LPQQDPKNKSDAETGGARKKRDEKVAGRGGKGNRSPWKKFSRDDDGSSKGGGGSVGRKNQCGEKKRGIGKKKRGEAIRPTLTCREKDPPARRTREQEEKGSPQISLTLSGARTRGERPVWGGKGRRPGPKGNTR